MYRFTARTLYSMDACEQLSKRFESKPEQCTGYALVVARLDVLCSVVECCWYLKGVLEEDKIDTYWKQDHGRKTISREEKIAFRNQTGTVCFNMSFGDKVKHDRSQKR